MNVTNTSKKRIAVYAASLDPITNGHINVIERMAPLYDELVVLVAVDSRKKYTFSPEERVSMAQDAVAHIGNVRVDMCVGQYVVKLADTIGAQVIIRGLRNFKDLEAEQTLAEENRRICPHIETILVPCLPTLMHVSSSMVKSHIGSDPDWESQIAFSVPSAIVRKLKEKYLLEKAQNHWSPFMARFQNPKGSAEIFKDLISRYSESHRSYHNLEHIIAMLDEFEIVSDRATNPNAVRMAIWFHDSVYDTGAKDPSKVAENEAQSAQLARSQLTKLGLSADFIWCVEQLILATKHNEEVLTDSEDDEALVTDIPIIVDLDLAILGKSEQEFEKYETGIRQEYAWVNEEDYRFARANFLQRFLERKSLYSTELFQTTYESTAWKNLERSIARLREVTLSA